MQHSNEFLEIVNDAKSRVKEINVKQAQERINTGAIMIDVREDNEWNAGHVKGALHLGRGVIERDIINTIPQKATELILYCGGGFRSALSADNLQKMGYTNVLSMNGGWKAWNDEGGAIE